MIEIGTKGAITEELIIKFSDEVEVEKAMESAIADGMSQQIVEKIDEMNFIELNHNTSTGHFEWEAKVLVCSQDELIKSVQEMAKRLKDEFGANEEQVNYCIEPITQ